jgi:ParB family chromosome partitioning protein
MTRKNWDPAAAALRAQTENPIANTSSAAAPARAATSQAPRNEPVKPGEYELVSVWNIDPAPWQSRMVFKDIEELANSIRGEGGRKGVGIVEPLLVRRMGSGRYGLIDGERRWRAAKVIAHERPEADFLVPVRVFTVSDAVAQLIGQAANEQRDQPKALEMAMTYVRVREALARESGQPVVGVRKVAAIGWHGRTMVNQYLAVAEAITPEILQAAGIFDEQGRAPEDLVTGLKIDTLHKIAKIESPADRVAALRAAADRVRGVKHKEPKPQADAVPVLTPAERLAQVRNGDDISIRVRGPVRTLEPTAAWRLVTQEVAPAMVALVEQGQGGTTGEGYLMDVGENHAVLVVPREVEQLSAGQLLRLAEDVSMLAKRVRRAARFRTRGARAS